MAIIDIIVGVKNEEEHIERCIKSLQKQTIQDINIVVVDGLSDDKTPEIVRELMTLDPRIVLLSNDKEKISSGRNIGLDFSKSEYVAYLDGHTYVQEDWLEILYNSFIELKGKCHLAGIGSTYASPSDDTGFGKTVAYCVQTTFGGLGTSFTQEKKVHKVDTVAFALYKRSVLDDDGIHYDEKMTHCEDTDFNYQLIKKGYILLKHPEALVYQYRRRNLTLFFMQMFKYGEGRYKLVKKYHETLAYYHLIPVFTVIYLLFVLICLILFLINQINSYTVILIFSPVILYLIIDISYTVLIMLKQRSLKHIFALLIFPAIHMGYGMGLIKGSINQT